MTLYALDGHSPICHADTWVAPDANLIGQVTLKAGASVWFGATLRGDNEPLLVGAGSNVQENCVLHTDMGFPLSIGENCTIGHKVMLHGCTIGDGALIGMGATVLNGAKIGKGCIIGAGALIAEGKEIEDFSLVMGAPGRVVRQVDEAMQQKILAGSLNYQNNMRRFREGLTPV